MTVSDYAKDVNLSVAEILKRCSELGISVKSANDELTDDDIIMLDNTINLISTDEETTFEEEEEIDDKVDEILTSSTFDKARKESNFKQKLKKKDSNNKNEFNMLKKEMYKHKNKLMSNVTDDSIVVYKNGMTVGDLATSLNVNNTDIIKKLMQLGLMLNVNQSIDFENAEIVALDYGKTLKREETQDVANFEEYEIVDAPEDLVK